jgi:hypothetical protein
MAQHPRDFALWYSGRYKLRGVRTHSRMIRRSCQSFAEIRSPRRVLSGIDSATTYDVWQGPVPMHFHSFCHTTKSAAPTFYIGIFFRAI